jgi:hypothetical protein
MSSVLLHSSTLVLVHNPKTLSKFFILFSILFSRSSTFLNMFVGWHFNSLAFCNIYIDYKHRRHTTPKCWFPIFIDPPLSAIKRVSELMVAFWEGQLSVTLGSRLGISAIVPLSSLNPENKEYNRRRILFILFIERELHPGHLFIVE